MSVILKGSPDFRKKHDAAGVVANIMFGFLPIIMLVAAVVFLIIQLLCLDDNIFVKIFQLIGSFLEVRVGYFFKDESTFSSVYRQNALEYTVRLFASASTLLIGSTIASFQCPECLHFFTLNRISDDKYEGSKSREVSQNTYEYSSAWTMGDNGKMYHTGITTKDKQYGTEQTDYYTYNLRCSCCGCVVKSTKSKTTTRWH